MITRAVLTLALLLTFTKPALSQTPQPAPVLSPRVEQVRREVRKIGIGGDITVILLTGREYYGAVSEMKDESFEVTEVDLKQKITLRYSEVKKVRKNYGGKNSLAGKRVNPHTALIVGIAVVGGLIALAFFAATQTR